MVWEWGLSLSLLVLIHLGSGEEVRVVYVEEMLGAVKASFLPVELFVMRSQGVVGIGVVIGRENQPGN